MTKGNRESKKPKKEKTKTIAAAPSQKGATVGFLRLELYQLFVQAVARSFLLRACYVEVLTPRNHLPIVSYP